MISQISDIIIHPITISDHAPVSLTWNMNHFSKPPNSWRLNTSLLEDPNFDTYIKREWASFLEINDSPNIVPSLLWETGKAVLRGKITSYSTHKKKKDTE